MADRDLLRKEVGGELTIRYKEIAAGVYAPYVETFTAAGAGSTDVTDRAGRLVGVVYGSQGAQVKQTATNLNLATEVYVGAAAVDPRSIRALTSADVVDVSDRVGRLVGKASIADSTGATSAPVSTTTPAGAEAGLYVRVVSQPAGGGGGGPADVGASTAASETDAARQKVTAALRVLDTAQVAGSQLVAAKGDQTTGLWVNVKNASLAVTGTFWQATQPVSGTFWQTTQPVSIAAAVDVSDRAARLVGVVYGSQAQQLKQTATNFNAQVEVAVGATLIDPRSIRTLTTADAVNVGQWIGSAAPTVGQKAMASSLPVVIASDQSAVPVSAASLPLPTGAATEATLTRLDSVNLSMTVTSVAVAQGAAGTTVLAAASAANKHKVIGVLLTLSADGTVKFTDGVADLTGPMDVAAKGGFVIPASLMAMIETGAINRALNLVTTGGLANGIVRIVTEP